MHQGIEIEVLGHTGRIVKLRPSIREWPVKPEGDCIAVWVELDPQVGSMGMYVHIPARAYTRDELVAAVTKEAERFLLIRHEGEEAQARREAKEQELAALVDQVRKTVGL